MYNPNRLEWLQDDEVTNKPRRFLCGLVVRQASLLSHFNRLAVALAKSQDHRASCGVFSFGTDRQSALADGLNGLNSKNTAHCYTPVQKANSVDLATVKAIGTSVEQGQLYKRTNPSCALGVFCCKYIKSGEVRNQSSSLFHPWRTVDK